MDIFDILSMIGGLCVFLFGMSIMGLSLEKAAGNKLKATLSRMTGNTAAGFFTGVGITSVIQSSSATTVMVVGFVNSGLLTLRQAINVILGANVGTTVTSWLLSLGGIKGDSVWINLLKPTSFTPILAVIGIVMFMFSKDKKKKDIGGVLLGFAVLMLGMDTMTSAVSGLKDVPSFRNLFLLFTNPLLGLLCGAVLTGIIQSSSASVGILQALSASGCVSYAAAIPIIFGQNIGTCVTAMLSSVGTNKGARRAALVHLLFNIIGAVICIILFILVKAIFAPAILNEYASMYGIAIVHSAFNVFCTAILMPAAPLLEKLVMTIIPENKTLEKPTELDERLLATPAIAIHQSRLLAINMANIAFNTLKRSMQALDGFTAQDAEDIRSGEDATDHYEDILGTYLLKLSSSGGITDTDSEEITQLLKLIGDFERIGDHAVNILESAQELSDKSLSLSDEAVYELSILRNSIIEVLDYSQKAFITDDIAVAREVEPLAQVIDGLKDQLRENHICRMKKGGCSIEAGFIWSDLLTNLERVSDHCSNISRCIIDKANHSMNMHEVYTSKEFNDLYEFFKEKYSITRQ